MGKEIKIGLIVIAVLLCLFGGALYLRLKHESPKVAEKTGSQKKQTARKSQAANHSADSTTAGHEPAERNQKNPNGKSLFAAVADSDRDAAQPPAASAEMRGGENPFGASGNDADPKPYRNAWSSAETEDDVLADDASPSDRDFATDDAAGDEQGGAADNTGSTGGDRYAGYASRRNRVARDDDPADGGQGALLGAPDGADSAEQAADESLAAGYRSSGDEGLSEASASDDGTVEMPDDRFQLRSAEGGEPASTDARDGALGRDELGRDELGRDELGRDELGRDELGRDELGRHSLGDVSSGEPSGTRLSRDAANGTEELADDSTSEADEREVSGPRGLAAPAQFEKADSHVRPMAGHSAGSSLSADVAADEEAPALAATDDARPLATGEGERSYTVEANDNFWRISQRLYGTGAYFKALREYNRDRYAGAEVMNVGDELAVPSIATLRRDYPTLCPKQRRAATRPTTSLVSSAARPRRGREYVVAEGDTLFDIARHELGKASRWLEVYELNREQLGDDFNYLAPGMRLALPANGPADDPVTTRDNRDRYQR